MRARGWGLFRMLERAKLTESPACIFIPVRIERRLLARRCGGERHFGDVIMDGVGQLRRRTPHYTP